MGKRCGQSVCIWSLIFKKPAEYSDFAKAFVNFEILLVARYTLKCNFIYVPSLHRFSRHAQMLNSVVHIAYTEFHSNRSINAESLERKSSEPLIKVRLSLRRFS